MAAGEETNETYYDSFELDSSISTVSSTDETKNIHTRVMVEDVNATGYETLSASIAQNTRFASIDIEKFDKMVKKNLADEVRSGLFFDQVCSYNDGTGNLIIVASAGQEGAEIARGNSMDPEFSATLAKWGLTIKSPYGRVKYIETATGEEKEAEIQSLSEYSNLCNSSDDWTASLSGGAVTVSNRGTNPITGVTISDQVRTIGNYFLHNCTYLTGALDISHVTSLGTHFLDGCTSFNSPISLVGLGSSSGQVPQYFMMGCSSFNSNINLGSVTWVDNGFLVDCVSFNKPLIFSNCSAVGDDFLYNNISFNSNLDFNPDFTWAGENFMYNCASFNKDLRVQRLYQINNGFMQNCISFNKALYFYQAISVGNDCLSGCTSFDSTLAITAAASIGNSFLANCESFDSQLVISNVTVIGNDFMRGCSGYSQGISFMSRVTTIGNNFMRGDTSFSGQVPLTSARTIGTGFLYGATSYNYNLTIPSTVQSIGAYFMYNCNAYTSTITFETPASVASANDPYTISSSSSSADLYTTGVTFEGTYAGDWARTFPTRTSPYRKVNTTTAGVITMTNNEEVQICTESELRQLEAVSTTPSGGTVGRLTFEIGGNTYNFSDIRSVNITKTTTTSIGDYFLEGATSLTSLSLPDYITSLGAHFLYACFSFNQAITLPSSLAEIGDYFMWHCSDFNQPLTIPEGVTIIPPYFLSQCTSFNSSLTLSPRITSIDDHFLYYCTSFNQPLTIPNTVTSIDDYFLYNCSDFNKPLTIPASTKTIGNYFMAFCSAFDQDFTLPSTITSIDMNYFFWRCQNFTSTIYFNLPFSASGLSSSSSISVYALSSASSSHSIYTTGFAVEGTYKHEWLGNKRLDTDNSLTGSHFRKIRNYFGKLAYQPTGGSETTICLANQADVGLLSWSASAQSITIGGNTFSNDDIVAMDVSTNIKSLPSRFLGFCTNLTSVKIHDELESIGTYFLDGCTSFSEDLRIPRPITRIPDYFLHNCQSFNATLTIPAQVDEIGTYFMTNCANFNQTLALTTVKIFGQAFLAGCAKYNQVLDIRFAEQIGDMFLWGCRAYNQNITIPNSVTSFGGFFMTGIENMTATVYMNCPVSRSTCTSDSSGGTRSFETVSQSCAAYTTGPCLGGSFKNDWKDFWPDNSNRHLRI